MEVNKMNTKKFVKLCKKTNKKLKKLNKCVNKHLAQLTKFSKEEWMLRIA